MKQLGVIFLDDLSTNNKVLQNINFDDPLLLYEPCDTFYQLKHHKHKITFLVSAIRHWKMSLEKKYNHIIHIKITKNRTLDLMHELEKLYQKIGFDILHVTQPSDHKTLTQLMFFASKIMVGILVK